MRRLLGIFLVLVFGAISGLCLLVGPIINGWNPPSSQCSQSTYPTTGGPFFENTRVQGYPTYLPLGMVCTYDVDGDTYGPQSVVHRNWPATIALTASVGLVGGGLYLAIAPRRRVRNPTQSKAAAAG